MISTNFFYFIWYISLYYLQVFKIFTKNQFVQPLKLPKLSCRKLGPLPPSGMVLFYYGTNKNKQMKKCFVTLDQLLHIVVFNT